MNKKKIRKCGYARVSTKAEEQEHSLSFQTHYYKTLIESERDSEFVGIYADTRSGKTSRLRKQFNTMIKAVRRGEIDYIYTKSIARFARNLVQTLEIVREFRSLGVGIVFEKEGIDTLDSGSDFILSIYATVAEGELTSMGDNVKWAARKRFAEGSVELSHIYGYEIKDGMLVLIPDEAAVVREIFERYASGEGQNAIARHLNRVGAKRKFSTELWKSRQVSIILKNEKYMGCAITQKTYKEGDKAKVNYGELAQYFIENNHESIVSRELWEAVQERLRQMTAVNKRTPYSLSPFSSKIKCKECGKGYLRRKNNRNTPYEKWIWSCQTYTMHGRQYCGGHNIRENDLLELFLSAYNEAAKYENQDDPTVILTDGIKALLQQERELVSLKVYGYITREAYEEQHGVLLKQIKDTEAALLLATRRSGNRKLETAAEYEDGLVGALEVAEIDGFTITFKFKNGADIRRTFNNDTDRKATWNRKLGRMA
jgi:DNA invertase Pin-like site-specific DNA recombinase